MTLRFFSSLCPLPLTNYPTTITTILRPYYSMRVLSSLFLLVSLTAATPLYFSDVGNYYIHPSRDNRYRLEVNALGMHDGDY